MLRHVHVIVCVREYVWTSMVVDNAGEDSLWGGRSLVPMDKI